MRKLIENMGFKNTWKCTSINYISRYKKIDSRSLLQGFKLYIFNGKLCMKSFIWEYIWIYNARYLILAAKKDDWWYAYALIIKNND